MYRQFNFQQFYVLPTQCIYMFCVDLRTNSHYFPIQHQLTVCITQTQFLHCAVRTAFLFIIQVDINHKNINGSDIDKACRSSQVLPIRILEGKKLKSLTLAFSFTGTIFIPNLIKSMQDFPWLWHRLYSQYTIASQTFTSLRVFEDRLTILTSISLFLCPIQFVEICSRLGGSKLSLQLKRQAGSLFNNALEVNK